MVDSNEGVHLIPMKSNETEEENLIKDEIIIYLFYVNAIENSNCIICVALLIWNWALK